VSAGVAEATRAIVWERDENRCQWCGRLLRRDVDVTSLQHRRPRGMGGSRRPDANEPQNLVLMCGTGTTECHGHVEKNRLEAFESGFLIRQHDDPLNIPLQSYDRRWWRLNADGTRTPLPGGEPLDP
jgi:hypothetical protein